MLSAHSIRQHSAYENTLSQGQGLDGNDEQERDFGIGCLFETTMKCQADLSGILVREIVYLKHKQVAERPSICINVILGCSLMRVYVKHNLALSLSQRSEVVNRIFFFEISSQDGSCSLVMSLN